MPDRRCRLFRSRRIHRQQHIQFGVIDRLGQVKGEDRLAHQPEVILLAPTCVGDDAGPRSSNPSTQLVCHIEARHARHAQVEQQVVPVGALLSHVNSQSSLIRRDLQNSTLANRCPKFDVT